MSDAEHRLWQRVREANRAGTGGRPREVTAMSEPVRTREPVESPAGESEGAAQRDTGS